MRRGPQENINAHLGNFENKSSSSAVIRALKKLTKIWNLFDRNPTAINHALANDSDINLNRKILETLTAAEKKVIKNLRTEPKPFYAHLNRKKLTKAAINSIKSAKSAKILRDPDRIAEEFAEFLLQHLYKKIKARSQTSTFRKKYKTSLPSS